MNTYLTPIQCAEQMESYAVANEVHVRAQDGETRGRARAYRHAATFLREFAVLKWTKGPLPRVAGVYWVRGRTNREDETIVVRRVWPVTNPSQGVLAAFHIGHDGMEGLVPIRDDEPALEWAGPLPEPVDATQS